MTDKTTFDPAGLCKTRAGLPVRIVCTDRRDRAFPYIGLYEDGSGEGVLHITADGRCAELPEGMDEWPEEGNPNDVVNCTPDDPCNALRRRSSVQEAAPADLTETAKRIAWGHRKYIILADTSKDPDEMWSGLDHLDRGAYISAAHCVAPAARSVAPAGVPEGWKLVPVEPTPEQYVRIVGGGITCEKAKAFYWAMLSAAPAAPTAQGQDTAPVQVREPVPVRCGSCGWLGDATELGEEGECGGDENCTGRPTEISDPAEMLEAWLDSEGLICGEALAVSGLIEQKPATAEETAEEAAQLDIEEGDTVWHISADGNALLDARRSSAPSAGEATR